MGLRWRWRLPRELPAWGAQPGALARWARRRSGRRLSGRSLEAGGRWRLWGTIASSHAPPTRRLSRHVLSDAFQGQAEEDVSSWIQKMNSCGEAFQRASRPQEILRA